MSNCRLTIPLSKSQVLLYSCTIIVVSIAVFLGWKINELAANLQQYLEPLFYYFMHLSISRSCLSI